MVMGCSLVTNLDTLTPSALDASVLSGDAASDAPSSDAADAASADAGPWTPAVIAQRGSLALWLEASSANVLLDQGGVGIWKDLSGNHNDATGSGTHPVVTTAALDGHDVVTFSNTQMYVTIADALTLQFGASEVFITAVVRASAMGGYLFSKAKVTQSGSGPQYASGLELFALKATLDAGTALFPAAHVDGLPNNEVDWGSPVFDDGKFHIVQMLRTKAFTIVLTVDDQPSRSGSTGAFDVSQVGTSVRIGAFHYGNISPPVGLDLAELLVVHDKTGIIGDPDVASLHSYLKAKYAL